ncbi:MAG: MFS transporter [Candidatus Hecatellaceae archaeon]
MSGGESSLFILCLAIFSVMLGLGFIAPLLPIYADSLGATGLEVGMVFAAFAVVRAATLTPMGSLSDYYGRKLFLTFGMLLYAMSSLLYLAAGTISHLIAVRAFHGFASALVVPAAMAMVADLYPSRSRGEAMGTYNTAYFAGIGFGPLLGGLLVEKLGFQAPFYACSLLALSGFILSLLKLKEPGRTRHPGKLKISYGLHLLKYRNISSVVFSRVAVSIGISSLFAFFPLLALKAGLSIGEVGFLLTVNMLVMIALQRRFGKLSDRIGRKIPLLAGCFLAGVSLIFLGGSKSLIEYLAYLLVFGFSGGLLLPASSAAVADSVKPESFGEAMGLFSTAISIGMALGPTVGGFLADLYGLPAIFKLAAAVCFLGMLIVALCFKDSGRFEKV